MTKTCELCNQPFGTNNAAQKFCGPQCRADYLKDESGHAYQYQLPLMARHRQVKQLRLAIFARDRFRCFYCGGKTSEKALQVDHVCPVENGGTNHPFNLVASCSDCNTTKDASVFKPEVLQEIWDMVFTRCVEDDVFTVAYAEWLRHPYRAQGPR